MSMRQILLVGNSWTGKSDVIDRLAGKPFNSARSYSDDYLLNRRVEHSDLHGDHTTIHFYKREIDSFQRLYNIDRFYRGAGMAILVYDISDRSSFNNLGYWLKEIELHSQIERRNIILVGNKCDLSSREISYAEALNYSQTHGLHQFMEVSAKDNTNIELLFANCLQTLGIDRPAPAASPLPAPPAPRYFEAPKPQQKMGFTILSSLLGTGGAITAGLALFGLLNVWNPLGWGILGGLILVASAITIGKINKSLSWGAIGFIPGINLFASIGYAARQQYNARVEENNNIAPMISSAPIASSSSSILTMTPASIAPISVLDPTSGELKSSADMPIAQPSQMSRGCWACLFGSKKQKPRPSSVPYTLDQEAANRNMSYF